MCHVITRHLKIVFIIIYYYYYYYYLFFLPFFFYNLQVLCDYLTFHLTFRDLSLVVH